MTATPAGGRAGACGGATARRSEQRAVRAARAEIGQPCGSSSGPLACELQPLTRRSGSGSSRTIALSARRDRSDLYRYPRGRAQMGRAGSLPVSTTWSHPSVRRQAIARLASGGSWRLAAAAVTGAGRSARRRRVVESVVRRARRDSSRCAALPAVSEGTSPAGGVPSTSAAAETRPLAAALASKARTGSTSPAAVRIARLPAEPVGRFPSGLRSGAVVAAGPSASPTGAPTARRPRLGGLRPTRI